MNDLNWVNVGNGKLALRGRPGKKFFDGTPQCSRIVTLLSEREGGKQVGEQAQKAGIAWTWLPLENAQPPEGETDTLLRNALPVLSADLDAGESVVIHCSAGIHRTGMVTYALLRYRGLERERALETLKALRDHTANGVQPHHLQWGDEVAQLK